MAELDAQQKTAKLYSGGGKHCLDGWYFEFG